MSRVVAVGGSPTDDEVAAVVAAFALLDAQQRAAAAAAPSPERVNVWVDASRRAAQRAGLQRGPWRLSGRIARRSRA